MGDLDVWWWSAFYPITQTTDLSSVLELVPLEEERSEGLAVVAHLRKLLTAAEIRVGLEGVGRVKHHFAPHVWTHSSC